MYRPYHQHLMFYAMKISHEAILAATTASRAYPSANKLTSTINIYTFQPQRSFSQSCIYVRQYTSTALHKHIILNIYAYVVKLRLFSFYTLQNAKTKQVPLPTFFRSTFVSK